MAPVFTTPTSPQKRPLSMANYDAHPSKKQRQFYHRHHTLQSKQQSIPGIEPALVGQIHPREQAEDTDVEQGPKAIGRSQVDDFLDHSIVSICEGVATRDGFKNASVDTWALEMFRGCVEEYVLNLCKYIRRSMLAARRAAPIATDLESAFQAVQVPTPEDRLPPRSKTKPPSSISLLPTPPPDDFFNTRELPESILGSDLHGKEEKRRDRHIPSTFPAFPSQHTFRDTPSLPLRERDPRRVRELATEEGRLGEQALRKLATAVRGEGKLNLSTSPDRTAAEAQRGGRQKNVEVTMEGMFEETMKELAKAERGKGLVGTTAAVGEGFEMAPIVNSERKYWMPDTSRRKPQRIEPPHMAAKAGTRHHGLSENARGKQRASDSRSQLTGEDLSMDFA